jgi:hypothetical protein
VLELFGGAAVLVLRLGLVARQQSKTVKRGGRRLGSFRC